MTLPNVDELPPFAVATLPRQSRAIEEHVAAELRPNLSRRVLDVGCGTGLVTRAYAGRVARVVAVDVSSGLIRRARTNLAACANVALVQADAVRLPFRDHSFDHILFCGVVPYLTREELYAALREMKRACKRGGSIFVCDLCDTRRELRTILFYGGPTASLTFLHYIGRRLRGRAAAAGSIRESLPTWHDRSISNRSLSAKHARRRSSTGDMIAA